eukprot:g4508.t1
MLRTLAKSVKRGGGRRFCQKAGEEVKATKKSGSSMYSAVVATALTAGGVVVVGCNLNSGFASKVDRAAPGTYRALSTIGLVPKKIAESNKMIRSPPRKMPTPKKELPVVAEKKEEIVLEKPVVEEEPVVEEPAAEEPVVELVEETPIVEEQIVVPEEIVKPAVEDLPAVEEEEETTADIEETTQTVSEAYDLISEVKDKKESLERLDTVIAAYQATDPQATFSDENEDESVTYQVTKTDEEKQQTEQQIRETAETSLLRVHAETLTKTLAAVEDVLQRGVEEESLFTIDQTTPETLESLRVQIRSMRHLLFERSKLEALRLKEALTQQEIEITESLETVVRKRLEEEYRKDLLYFEQLMKEQREEHERNLQLELEKLRRELEAQLAVEVEMERERGEVKARDARAASLKVHTKRLQETRARLAKLEDLVNNNIRLKSYKQNSDEVHRLTLASLAFSNDVMEESQSGKSLGHGLSVLRGVMGSSDELATRSLNLIPEDVKSGETTVPSWVNLSKRFEVCKSEALSVAYVPSPSIMGLALSKLTNMIMIRPTADTMYESDTIDCRLERASALLNVGRHLEAYQEVKAVRKERGESDPVSVVLDAWLEDTRKRLILDQSLKTVHAVNTRMSCMFSA